MKKSLSKILLLFIFCILVSCKGIPFENQKIAKAEEFARSEAMIFVVEEKNKYESKFGKELWNLKSGNGNQFFKNYVVSNVKKYIEKIMKLKLVADDLNIIIGNTELEKIDDASEEYYSSLESGDIEYIGCNIDNVRKAFRDFHIARLTVDNLAKNANLELSVSEAKVIKVQYIVFDDIEKAKETLEALNAKGASFSYFAKTRSKDTEIEMIIKRGDEMSTKFPELFYLSDGQLSQILQNINKYYIFKCIEDYMVDETEARRIEILSAMKNEEFNDKFAKYDEQYQLKSNSAYWKEIDLAEGEACTIYKFEDIYYKYFPRDIK